RDRRVHRLVQSPASARRDRHDSARRARGRLPSQQPRTGTRRRGTCEPLTNPGRFTELTARGLTTPPTPRRPSKPIGRSSLHRILTNPYYKGDVTYQGVTYKGTHPALVPAEVWYQMQTVLSMHRS